MHFSLQRYDSNVNEGMQTALSALSRAQSGALQKKISKEIGEWLPRQASGWGNLLAPNSNSRSIIQSDNPRNPKSRRMVDPPDDLSMWANDAFRYCSNEIRATALQEYGTSSERNDFSYRPNIPTLMGFSAPKPTY